jgi:PAS domain S-box-containing protein
MIAHEQKLLGERERQTEQAYFRAVFAGILMTLTGLAAVGMFVSLLSRSQRLQKRDAALIAEQRQLLSATLTSIGDAVIATDSAARITFLNAVAERLTGWTQKEAEGQPLDAVFRIENEETREPVGNPALRALKEGTIVGLANHTILVANDGTERPIDDSAAPIRDEDGKVIGTVLVFRDVTERRKSERTLRQMAAELSHADRRKDEFLATLAHELRNPLAPLRNGLVLMRLSKDTEADFEQVLSMMERQFAQLMRLVDDLMDVSRIARGRLDIRKEKVLLADVIGSAVEVSRPLVKEMRHELTVNLPEELIVVEGDPTRLAQVFMNLLTNAVKYTDVGGRIWVTAEKQGSVVLVTVKDTGIGIAAEHLPRIFNMFSQLDHSLEKAQGGLGIGLTLVKELVEMHRGTVEARSDGLGKGSEFSVCLPIDSSAQAPQAEGPPTEAATPKSAHRVLVVDDNRDLADTLAIMLKKLGNEARSAYDGEHGLQVAEEFRPDVALLDIGLPKLNGYEVCRRIRGVRGKGIVLIAITGYGQEQDRQRSQEAGFDYHLVKPVDLKALREFLLNSKNPSLSGQ